HLRAKTAEFRLRFEQGETLEDLLPEAFAVVREAGRRTLNMRHFDVQLIGGMVLHRGKIAEMKTGEGKTLVATLPAYLNALAGKGVHVVTVNDYLARRDSEWMGRIYRFLGMTVGVIQHDLNDAERQRKSGRARGSRKDGRLHRRREAQDRHADGERDGEGRAHARASARAGHRRVVRPGEHEDPSPHQSGAACALAVPAGRRVHGE